MADEPDAAPERRSRTERSADAARRRRMWQRIAIAVAVLAVAAAVAFLFLGDGGSLVPGDGDGSPTAFSFELASVRAAPTSDRSAAQLQDEADEAAGAVKATMDRLYSSAYLDEGAWGSYDDVFALFQGPAADGARDDADALTLGTAASQEYEMLADPTGRLQVVVLTNDRNVAVSAIARVVFRATAELSSGGSTRIVSSGAFFLRPAEDGWRIFAYRIDRDEGTAASPSPSGEATP